MAECNWDPNKHGGKPCPTHGAGGSDKNHKVRINNGKYEVQVGDGDWEEVSREEFDELKEGGYSEFDENEDADFEGEFDEVEDIDEDVDFREDENSKAKKAFEGDPTEGMTKSDYIDYLENVKGWDHDEAVNLAKLFYNSNATKYDGAEVIGGDEDNSDFDLNDKKTRNELTDISENLDENKISKMNQEREDKIEETRQNYNSSVKEEDLKSQNNKQTKISDEELEKKMGSVSKLLGIAQRAPLDDDDRMALKKSLQKLIDMLG